MGGLSDVSGGAFRILAQGGGGERGAGEKRKEEPAQAKAEGGRGPAFSGPLGGS